MKIKSSVLFGLIVVIFSVSGFSLLKRLTKDVDEWRPSDLYSTTNVSRRSTYSVVSSGASASYSGAAPSVSSGASSMFRRRAVSSYAPAVSAPANSFSPFASSPLASSPQGGLYATSSAEFRSFGGGGNAGGVSMSGGSVKSSGSSVAPASGLSVSMPNASMYAFAVQGANNNIPVVSGDAAIAAMTSASSYTTAYSGIGRTTGGDLRGIGGRKNLAIGGDNDEANVEDTWLNWLALMGIDVEDVGHYDEATKTWYYDYYELHDLYEIFCAGWNSTMGKKPTWDEWLSWFMGSEGNPYIWSDGDNQYGFSFVPVGDYTPLFVLALVYVVFGAYRRRQLSKMNCEKQ